MFIADRMRKNPITVTPDMSVDVAANIMKKEGIHNLPVLDDKKRLVGLLTEHHILLATPSPVSSLSTYEMDYLVGELKVKEIMDKHPITITTKTTVDEAARIMSDNNAFALPVMEGNNLVGIVTKNVLFDLLLELFGARQYGITCEVLVEDRPGVMTELLKYIADAGLDVISNAVTLGKDPSTATISIKIRNTTKEQVADILRPHVIDIISTYAG